jgi:DNA invertase Pin-like site-specific DNA recombinase
VAKSAIGYLGASTAGQAEEGVSLDAQRAKVEAWCLANDVELTGMFVDAGVSGKRADNRPQPFSKTAKEFLIAKIGGDAVRVATYEKDLDHPS